MSPGFAWGHRNKRSLGLDLRSDEGKAIFLALVAGSDLVLSNFRPGTLESLGLGYEELAKANPAIVVVDSSALGSSGPESRSMGYGPLVRAATGLTALWRYPGEPDGFSDSITIYPDHTSARIGAVGALAKLIGRAGGQPGGTVSVAQAEVMLNQFGPEFLAESLQPGSMTADGDACRGDAPYGVYPCAGEDQWCAITIRGDGDWDRLCTVIGAPDLAASPALRTAAGRVANRADIDLRLSAWTARHDPQLVMRLMQDAGVPAGAMARDSDLRDDPQLRSRRFFTVMLQPGLGELPTVTGPAIFRHCAGPRCGPRRGRASTPPRSPPACSPCPRTGSVSSSPTACSSRQPAAGPGRPVLTMPGRLTIPGGWRSGSRPSRAAWPFLVALIVAMLAGACSSPGGPAPGGSAPGRRGTGTGTGTASTGPAKAVAPPDTQAGGQLRWLLAAMARLPVPGAQVDAHFDAAFRAEVSPAVLEGALQTVAGAGLRWIQVSELNTVTALVSAGDAGAQAQIWLTVDAQGLISALRISPDTTGPTPGTWADVDATVRSVAPQVRLLVADVSNGSCQLVHGIDPGAAAPIGAAFKLYVLDALGQAAAAGTVGWNQPLTVTTQLKSLPAGDLQNDPDGTQVSVLEAAAAMMSLSDNTATDMLINLVGRSSVEAALSAAGMASPALDQPLLDNPRDLRPQAPPMAGARDTLRGRRRVQPPGPAGRHGPRPGAAARGGVAGSWDRATRHQQPGIFRLGQRPVPGLRIPRHAGPPAGPGPDRRSALAQRHRPGPGPGPVADNLVQGRIRARCAGHGLPGHDQDRAQLCRHRAGREPRAAHRRSRRDTGHAVGDQGRVHAGGTRVTRARRGRHALDTRMAAAHDGVAGRPG